MLDPNKINQLNDLLPQAQHLLVILTPSASLDQAASAFALADSLKQAGKDVTVITPMPEDVQRFSSLVAPQEIHDKLGNRDLTIGFEYQAEAVDKVSYHIDEDNQRFYLVIKPQKGQKPLSPESVQFSYSGAEADMIFLVGVHEFEALNHLYVGFEQLYQDTTTVTFHSFEPTIGNIKLDGSGTSCLSESMAALLQTINLPLTPDGATNLLSAIEEATNHFQSYSANAATFATVAQLMNAGARRTNRSVATPVAAGAATDFSQALKTQQPVMLEAETAPKKLKISSTKKKPTKKDEAVGSLQYQPSEASVGGGG